MTFLWPDMLYLLVAVPLLVLAYWRLLRRTKTLAVRYASLAMVKDAIGIGQRFRRHVPPVLFLVALTLMIIAIARPLTVFACLLPDRRGGWTREELLFLCWCRETGVVPAAVAALLLSRGVPGAEEAVTMVAFAIVTTLLLQATTAGLVARRLGLLDDLEPVPS